MRANKPKIDKVRASRDGHEFHEAWAARRALQLLWPASAITAIAIEGLSPLDQQFASAAAGEVADLTIYRGSTSFKHALSATVCQFKYSISYAEKPYRASDAKDTILKFAKLYQDYKKKYGDAEVDKKLDFEIITNRPISDIFIQSLTALVEKGPVNVIVGREIQVLSRATKLKAATLRKFASKLRLFGGSGTLGETKGALAGQLVDWSASRDALAKVRLGDVRELIRTKAGTSGQGRNLVRRTDVLGALGIADTDELLPCASALPSVGPVLERPQQGQALAMIEQGKKPLLIHAAGGVGKTVLMSSLASALERDSEVVLFDCFGGGSYRSPEDKRHLPKNALIHIANTLAFRGLCDPILPSSNDDQLLLRTFRRRLQQCLQTLRRFDPAGRLHLLIDAMDNAELFARECGETSFANLLLRSLHQEPVDGLSLVLSCRTERQPVEARYCDTLELAPFDLHETTAYLKTRQPAVSEIEAKVAHARSGGNPRVLEYLVSSGTGLLDALETTPVIHLDTLIEERIDGALSEAVNRGYSLGDAQAFLAGLVLLPPPVPLDEYAEAHGMSRSEIESFAADMRPLLERTNQGLIFRDEPTETFVREHCLASSKAIRRVVANLKAHQAKSAYAARALPGVLFRIGAGGDLFRLAFDEQMPSSVTSVVGQRLIRYSRISAAVRYATGSRDYSSLTQLLAELSRIAASDQRGADYLLDHPDLVAAAADTDSMRRLFETKTPWPGTRHSRLAIVNCLLGEVDEAYRHARWSAEWIAHYNRQDPNKHIDEKARITALDAAAVPFLLASEGRYSEAVEELQRWRDWFSFEVAEHVLHLLELHAQTTGGGRASLEKFSSLLTSLGPLAAALALTEISPEQSRVLIRRLAAECQRSPGPGKPGPSEQGPRKLEECLLKAAAFAFSLGMAREVRAIVRSVSQERDFSLWSMRDGFYSGQTLRFILRKVLLREAADGKVREWDLLPHELLPLASRIRRNLTGKDFASAVRKAVHKFRATKPASGEMQNLSELTGEQAAQVDVFLDRILPHLLYLSDSLASLLRGRTDRPLTGVNSLLTYWRDILKDPDPWSVPLARFVRSLFQRSVLFAVWTWPNWQPKAHRKLAALGQAHMTAWELVEIVKSVARVNRTRSLAGELAVHAQKAIEAEDDVALKAKLLGDLARAILPSSIEEARAYFRGGLDRMDAVGSGDQDYLNELMLFASRVRGDPLQERDFHALTNICELNLGEEPEKFFWGAFGQGMSRVAGLRGLAKLSRWDDRARVKLDNTLQPYLTALVEAEQLEPDLAIAAVGLIDPAEYWYDGTKEFVRTVHEKGASSTAIRELIFQFLKNNPDGRLETTLTELLRVGTLSLGKRAPVVQHLRDLCARAGPNRDVINEHLNYRGKADRRMASNGKQREAKQRRAIRQIIRRTNPADTESLSEAISAYNKLEGWREARAEFFDPIRKKVPFSKRLKYAQDLLSFEHLNLYGKVAELTACREAWSKSSSALSDGLSNFCSATVRMHVDDLINQGRLSGRLLSEFCAVINASEIDGVLALIVSCCESAKGISGAVWIELAGFVATAAPPGAAQQALSRLLASDVAALADTVADGPWRKGLYPGTNDVEVLAGLVWRRLGSPSGEARWRAAHVVRRLALLGRWDVIDRLVKWQDADDATCYQAAELKFYVLHARLWLLIALARVAVDFPESAAAKYKSTFLSTALAKEPSHVAMKHFALSALAACARVLRTNQPIQRQLAQANISTFPRRHEQADKVGIPMGLHRRGLGRSGKVDLSYEFEKSDVNSLARIFGRPADLVSRLVVKHILSIDADVTTMADPGGRPASRSYDEATSGYHVYGQYLSWHALFLSAGDLLQTTPLLHDPFEEDPWRDWLDRYLLKRADGLWVSDGVDPTPASSLQILKVKAESGLALTGEKEMLLSLAGIKGNAVGDTVVYGRWYSADGVSVSISSALAEPRTARSEAKRLVEEKPMMAWLPTGQNERDCAEGFQEAKGKLMPWVIVPPCWLAIEEDDPLAVAQASAFPHLLPSLGLKRSDPFGREWSDERSKGTLCGRVWGYENKFAEGAKSGSWLVCSAHLLKKLLSEQKKDLLILIRLEDRERGGRGGSFSYSHTVAVAQITKDLKVRYFQGATNALHKGWGTD